jgi:hypothetical protein
LEGYHEICYWSLSHRRTITVFTDMTVNLAAVIACSSSDQLQHFVEIASLSDVDAHCFSDWYRADSANGVVLENGWTRYFASPRR